MVKREVPERFRNLARRRAERYRRECKDAGGMVRTGLAPRCVMCLEKTYVPSDVASILKSGFCEWCDEFGESHPRMAGKDEG